MNDTIDKAYLDVNVRKDKDFDAALKKIGVDGQKAFDKVGKEGKELDRVIKALGVQTNITRKSFQAGITTADEFEREMIALDRAHKQLLTTQKLNATQMNRLTGSARTAQSSLDTYRGKVSKLGLAHNTLIAQTGAAGAQFSHLTSMGLSAGAALGGAMVVGAGAATAALYKAADAAADVADEIDKGAQTVGLSVEAYQELSFVFDQNGVSSLKFRNAIGTLNQRIGQAAQGNTTYQKTFDNLGVSIFDANGKVKDTEVVFFEAIKVIESYDTAAERAGAASKLFGDRVGREMGPLLNQGSAGIEELRQKAIDLGLVIDRQTVQSLVEYKDRMAQVRTQMRNAGVEISAKFLPLLEGLANFVSNSIVPAMETWDSWMNAISGRFNTFLTGDTVNYETAVNLQVEANNTLIDSLEGLTAAQAESAQQRINAEIAATNIAITSAKARVKALVTEAGAFQNLSSFGVAGGLLSVFTEARKGALNNAISEVGVLVDQLTELNEMSGAISAGDFGFFDGGLASGANNAPVSSGASTGSRSSASSSSSSASSPRTVQDVFDQLEIDGINAQRKAAAFNNTIDAQKDSLKTRISLVDRALTEVIGLGGTAAQVDFLAKRLDQVKLELYNLRDVKLDTIKPTATTGDFIAIPLPSGASSVSGLQNIPIPQAGAGVSSELVDIATELLFRRTGTGLIPKNLGSTVASRDVTPLPTASVSRSVDVSDVKPLVDVVKELSFSLEPVADVAKSISVLTDPSVSTSRSVDVATEALRIILSENSSKPRQFASVTPGISVIPDVSVSTILPTADAATRNFSGLTGRGLGSQTNSTLALANQLGIASLGPDGSSEEGLKQFRMTLSDSGDQFAQTIIASAGQAGNVLIGVLSGNTSFGGAVAGIGGAAGSIIGAVNPLAGAAVSIGSSFFGGLLDLFGQDSQSDRANAIRNQSRALPAISLTIDVQQTNQYSGSHTDAAEQARYTRNTLELVEEIREVVFSNLVPRVGSLESNNS